MRRSGHNCRAQRNPSIGGLSNGAERTRAKRRSVKRRALGSSFSYDACQKHDARMKSLTRYILQQCLNVMLFVTAVLTATVWLAQSLRLVDLIVNRGLSAEI